MCARQFPVLQWKMPALLLYTASSFSQFKSHYNASWWFRPKITKSENSTKLCRNLNPFVYTIRDTHGMFHKWQGLQQINKNNFLSQELSRWALLANLSYSSTSLVLSIINVKTFGADCHFSTLSPLLYQAIYYVNQGRSRTSSNKTMLSSFHTNNFKDRMSHLYIYTQVLPSLPHQFS